MQHTSGEFSHHDLISVGFLQGCNEDPGFYRTVIDEEGLQGTAGTGIGRLADVTGQTVAFPAALHLHHLAAFSAVYTVDRGFQLTGTGGGQHFFAIADETEGHLRMGQGLQLHGCGDSATLHGVRLHEFHAGRGIEKEISYDNGGAVGTTGFGFFGDRTGFQRKTGAGNAAGSLGQQVNAADGGDGSQCLTTETHGCDGG